jgi:menaquinone-dependent protoporphyrinogen IX oxidase
MKTVVIYKSKTGFAKRYAEWIAGELAADLYESSQITIAQITAYDTVIYGGGLYISGINGVELITKNLDILQGKRIVVFGVGATPGREEEIREVQDANFTPEQQQQIRFFYLRGGYDYNKLKPVDKVLNRNHLFVTPKRSRGSEVELKEVEYIEDFFSKAAPNYPFPCGVNLIDFTRTGFGRWPWGNSWRAGYLHPGTFFADLFCDTHLFHRTLEVYPGTQGMGFG